MTRPVYEQDIPIIVSAEMAAVFEQWCDRYARASEHGLSQTEREQIMIMTENAVLLGQASAIMRELRHVLRNAPPPYPYPLPSRRPGRGPDDTRQWPDDWSSRRPVDDITAGINPLTPPARAGAPMFTPSAPPRDHNPVDQLGDDGAEGAGKSGDYTG